VEPNLRATTGAGRPAADSPGLNSDGRAARRERNRTAVIDACLELFSEGNLQPGPNEVALHCGLSLRSVQRYFEDGDALLSAAIGRKLETVYPLYHIRAIGQGGLDHRIECLLTIRLEAHEVIGATARAATLVARKNALVSENFDLARLLLRNQIETQFAPELDVLAVLPRQSKVAAIDALLQFDSLDYYRQRRQFSLAETRILLTDTLHALLGGLREEPPGRGKGRSRRSD
jgi:AcrR family transcriptional regulator